MIPSLGFFDMVFNQLKIYLQHRHRHKCSTPSELFPGQWKEILDLIYC